MLFVKSGFLALKKKESEISLYGMHAKNLCSTCGPRGIVIARAPLGPHSCVDGNPRVIPDGVTCWDAECTVSSPARSGLSVWVRPYQTMPRVVCLIWGVLKTSPPFAVLCDQLRASGRACLHLSGRLCPCPRFACFCSSVYLPGLILLSSGVFSGNNTAVTIPAPVLGVGSRSLWRAHLGPRMCGVHAAFHEMRVAFPGEWAGLAPAPRTAGAQSCRKFLPAPHLLNGRHF